MSSLNIILCGYLPSTIVVCLPDPSKWTVSDLKQEVIKHVPKATANDITLYVGEDEVPEGKPLCECGGVRNGTGLIVSIKPFIINVYSPDVDVTATVEIPLVEFDSWKVSTVLKAILFKLGITRDGKEDILAFNGKPLNDPTSSIFLIPDIFNRCLMTYTMFNRRALSNPEGVVNGNSLIPIKVSNGFAQSRCYFNRRMRKDNNWLSDWQIVVQQLDGSQTAICVPNPHKMSVIDLRKAVEKVLSVPTHQQKLLLGDSRTVLEDWKSTAQGYREMLINDYASFCDGIKLYLIQLSEGIHVKVSKDGNPQYDSWGVGNYGYIDVHNPREWTLEQFATLMKMTCTKCSTKMIYLVHSSKSVSPSSKPVSSVEWITDGCILTLHGGQ